MNLLEQARAMEDKQRNTLNEIRIKKDNLLTVLKENLASHDELFNAATQAYASAVAEEVAEKVDEAKKIAKFLRVGAKKFSEVDDLQRELYALGAHKLSAFKSVKPTSYASHYKSAIRKVELSVEDEFSLSNAEFEQYVQNNWSWKSDFIKTATHYATTGLHMGTVSGALMNFSK